MNNIYANWLVMSLFWLGILIVILGVAMIVIPQKVHEFSIRLNHWISTEHYFEQLDRSRPVERIVYKNHMFVGIAIILGSAYCLYVFIFGSDIDYLVSRMPLINNNVVMSDWLYSSLIYILIFANMFCFLLGLIIVIRPSSLKWLEKISNYWVESNGVFSKLDKTHSIPEHILPGNMRLFGFAVTLGGLFIVLNMAILFF